MFNTNEIKSTNCAFAIAVYSETGSDRNRSQHITFSDNFNSKYSRSSYVTNTNFHNTFCGYTNTVTFRTKTLSDDPITYNYYIYGNA